MIQRLLPACLLAISGLLAAGCGDRAVIAAGGTCTANKDCAPGETCVAGQCSAGVRRGCRTDEECGEGRYCELTTRVCTERGLLPCSDDSGCPSHQECHRDTNMCVDRPGSCAAEGECPRGYHCKLEARRCVECVEDRQCRAGERCSGDRCTTSTSTSGDAAVGVDGSAASASDTGEPAADGGMTVPPPDGGEPVQTPDSGMSMPPDAGVPAPDCADGDDLACAPPLTVCVNSYCVPGCGQVGGFSCSNGEVCDRTAGRCIPILGPCSDDSACTPPELVCEFGQCVNGCHRPGGLQCSGGMSCDSTTGRCVPGTATCQSDMECAPPSTICNAASSTCEPGCGATGCMPTEVCSPVTGRCADVGEVFTLYSDGQAASPRFAGVMPRPVMPPTWSSAQVELLTGSAPEGANYIRLTGVQNYDAVDIQWSQPVDLTQLVGGHIHLRVRVSPQLRTSGIRIAMGNSAVTYPAPGHIMIYGGTASVVADLGTGGQWWEIRMPFTRSLIDAITWNGGLNITQVDTIRIGNPGVAGTMTNPWWVELDDIYFSSRP